MSKESEKYVIIPKSLWNRIIDEFKKRADMAHAERRVDAGFIQLLKDKSEEYSVKIKQE